MEQKVIEFGDYYMTGTLRLYPNGQIGVSINRNVGKDLKNKYIVLDCDSAYDEFDYIARRTHITPDYCAGDPIWVHPKARLSRDVIRNSGYAITRSKEKAEYIVIPEPNYNQFFDISYHIVCLNGNTPYFFTVNDTYNREIPDEKFESAKERIKQYLDNENVIFLCDDMELKKACFFPKIEEYKNLIEENDADKTYVFDTKLKLSPSVDISIETLDVWRRLNDENMLARFICASNWQDYPLTLKLFLEEYQYGIKWVSNNNISMIVKELGIGEEVTNDMLITAKDYNMLVSWIYHLVNKPIGSTYITQKDWEKVPKDFKKLIKKRVAISPVTMTTDDMIYDNIINEAKN